MAATLDRQVFETSRLLEFFSEKELSMQIGHDRHSWPLALVKELIDNSLDACEGANILPEIAICLDRDSVTVSDNGPGLPAKVIERSLDYSVRVSTNNGYISPTRGQLGNALKCVWAAPYIATGTHGRVDVHTGNTIYAINVSLDRIAQAPRIEVEETLTFVRNGTSVKMCWPNVARYLDFRNNDDFYNILPLDDLVSHYALLNPHVSFIYEHAGVIHRHQRTAETCEKWVANAPTSVYWYSTEALRTLVAANLKAGRDITVREFAKEFRGLTSTAKQKAVTDKVGLSGARLSSLVVDDDLDMEQVETLLQAMKEQSQPVKPRVLGMIGAAHIRQWMIAEDVYPDQIEYRSEKGETIDGHPFIVECAIGLRKGHAQRSIIAGLNWTPTLSIPSHKIEQWFSSNRVEWDDPIVAFVHITCPKFSFTDRGKARLGLDGIIANALERLIGLNAAEWKRNKKQDEQSARAQQRMREEKDRRTKQKDLSIKDACHLVMVEALQVASDNGRYPVLARQVMYAARRLAQQHIGSRWFKESKSFTQVILPDWQNDNPKLAEPFDIVYDDRGHFVEPHRGTTIGVGTIPVRRYVNSVNPHAMLHPESDDFFPVLPYSAVLFVEKEGFQHILQESGIADRYDVAILSTKGQTVTAARLLAEELTKRGVKLYVLHDFDKSGLEIEYWFRNDNRRWTFDVQPDTTDIGIRLADVDGIGLDSEEVIYKTDADPRLNLLKIGASQEECDFLVSQHDHRQQLWKGQRVEINAMTAPQLIAFIEDKLKQCGVKKVMAGRNVLERSFKQSYKDELIELRLEKYRRQIEEELANFEAETPDDLQERVSALCVTGESTITWQSALARVVSHELRRNERGDQ